MVTMHGRPGHFAKDQASRQFGWMIWGLLLTMMASGLSLGFVYGRFRSWQTSLGGLLAVGAVMLVMLRLMDKPMAGLARRRIRYLRGAQGEALVGWILKDLPGTWHVFHGLKLHDAGDIDHIVVGPGGLFCMSTKANRGLYACRLTAPTC
jgi:hypothetical protein